MRTRGQIGRLATHFSSRAQAWSPDPEVHMFTEDVCLGLMPVGGRTSKKEFAVQLDGAKSHCEAAAAILEQLSEEHSGRLPEIVSSAIEVISRDLAHSGFCYYEIVHTKESIPSLISISPEGLWKIGGYYVQHVPIDDRHEWRRRFSWADASAVWRIRIPASLGGPRVHRQTIHALREVDRLGPGFFQRDLQQGKQDPNFSFGDYVRHSENRIRRLTRRWGWNSRDWGLDRQTEFYAFDRMMQFKWAQAVLREQITADINSLFSRLSWDSNLVITGLPSPAEIWDTHTAMTTGVLSMAKASDAITF